MKSGLPNVISFDNQTAVNGQVIINLFSFYLYSVY